MNRYALIILKFIKKKDLAPKLGSILLAVILWAYISNAKSGDVKFKLPVTVTGLEDNYIISKMSHKAVVVEVRGSIDELKNISSRNVKLSVDLSKSEPGELKTYKIKYQKVDFTDDFKIEIYPEEIKILIEKKASRNVVVIPRFSGIPDKGFMAGRIRVNPEYIRVTGPLSVISRISAVYTEDIAVNGKNASFRQETGITKLDEEGLEYSQVNVTASVPLVNYLAPFSLDIPVSIRNKKQGMNYRLSSEAVKISVIPAAGVDITAESYSAYIDAYEIPVDADELDRKGKVEASGYVHVTGGSPETENNILLTTPETIDIIVTKK